MRLVALYLGNSLPLLFHSVDVSIIALWKKIKG